jgi:hypothetical protein
MMAYGGPLIILGVQVATSLSTSRRKLLVSAFVVLFLTSTTCTTPAFAFSVEQKLAEHATPLQTSPSNMDAAAQLLSSGVCRLNNVLPKSTCSKLRDYVLDLRRRQENENSPLDDLQDLRNIPGTRLRFSEPVFVNLNKRTDILLPIEDTLVSHVLQELAEQLGSVLLEGAELLPGRPKTGNENDETDHTMLELELVEAACLISDPGSTHQTLHADYRRDAPYVENRLPPRLVTFLYLQDTPTVDHGPTIFLPCTNNVELSSGVQVRKRLQEALNKEQEEEEEDPENFFDFSAKCASLSAGDVAIYDASVLHFGSANSIPENTRAVFYFGVGWKGAAEAVSSLSSLSLQNLHPISMVTTTPSDGDKIRFSHSSIQGMTD